MFGIVAPALEEKLGIGVKEVLDYDLLFFQAIHVVVGRRAGALTGMDDYSEFGVGKLL